MVLGRHLICSPRALTTLSVSLHRTVFGLGRPFTDGDGLLYLPARLSPRRSASGSAHHPPGTQMGQQFPLETAGDLLGRQSASSFAATNSRRRSLIASRHLFGRRARLEARSSAFWAR